MPAWAGRAGKGIGNDDFIKNSVLYPSLVARLSCVCLSSPRTQLETGLGTATWSVPSAA